MERYCNAHSLKRELSTRFEFSAGRCAWQAAHAECASTRLLACAGHGARADAQQLLRGKPGLLRRGCAGGLAWVQHYRHACTRHGRAGAAGLTAAGPRGRQPGGHAGPAALPAGQRFPGPAQYGLHSPSRLLPGCVRLPPKRDAYLVVDMMAVPLGSVGLLGLWRYFVSSLKQACTMLRAILQVP